MEQHEEQITETGVDQDIARESGADAELARSGGGVAARPKISIRQQKEEIVDLDNEPEGQLTIDVYQTPNEIIIESAVAGVEPADLDIDVNTDSVTIKGRRHREKSVKDEDYIYQECYWGRFARSVILPQEIDADESRATFKNGILTIRLPKLKRQKGKKLRVKSE